jgi:diamine N-acetyltransferase
MTLSIAPLAAEEVETLCALARAVWRHHYPPIIGTAQTEYMLAQRYDPEVIRSELTRNAIWWDTLREEDSIVAFASSFPVESGDALKLDKLYVHPTRQRCGYGGVLIEHVCQRAARLKYSRVVLAVNRRNDTAIASYRKHGFEIAEAVVQEIGGGFVMDDFIMQKSVAAEMPLEQPHAS